MSLVIVSLYAGAPYARQAVNKQSFIITILCLMDLAQYRRSSSVWELLAQPAVLCLRQSLPVLWLLTRPRGIWGSLTTERWVSSNEV